MGKSVPIINQWYQDIAVNRLFEVIAVDEYSALIDIRYADPYCEDGSYKGSSDENSGFDEIGFDDWSQMAVVPARTPEDWRNSSGIGKDAQMLAADIVMPTRTGSMDNIEAVNYLFGWDEY